MNGLIGRNCANYPKFRQGLSSNHVSRRTPHATLSALQNHLLAYAGQWLLAVARFDKYRIPDRVVRHPQKAMKPCFGYVRVSTQKQGEGVSLQAQQEAITAFASRHGLTVTEWFEEKETAAKSGRPVFTKMLKSLARGTAKGLIIHKIDRSARNLKDWAVISELSDAGVDVYFANESLDFRSRGGRLTADIQAVIAADFIRNLREETIKGMTGRLKQGLYPFRAPLGYLDNGRGQPKTPCPIKAPLIRHAFELYASGRHSLRSLQAEMNQLGLRNLSGQPISLHGIETILRNPFYCGTIEITRTGQVYNGTHEPLIDVRTFNHVQDVKAGRAGKKVTKHDHLYRGLFRCGHCDAPMSPELQKGRVYYRCQTSACPTKTIREDEIASEVERALLTLQLTDENAAELEQHWDEWLSGQARSEVLRSLDLRLDQAKTRQTRLTDLLLDGTLSNDEFNTRKRTLVLEIRAIEEERDKATKNHLAGDEMKKYLELMKSLVLLHRSGKPAEKRMMVKYCFSNRKVHEKKLCLEPYNWLQEVKNASGVSFGDPERHTSRRGCTVGDSEFHVFVRNFIGMFEECLRINQFAREEESYKLPIPQWKFNFKNQNPNDLQNV
jgi:site-specific DNA recombinase